MTLQIKKIEEPLQIWLNVWIIYNLMILRTSLQQSFMIFDQTAGVWSKIISERLPWLAKTEEALRSFKGKIEKIREAKGIYLKLREAYDRTPAGYITEIRIVIPDSNRNVEYQIYESFGELLREPNALLFDLHIIRLRGRELEEAVPEGFWRYE